MTNCDKQEISKLIYQVWENDKCLTETEKLKSSLNLIHDIGYDRDGCITTESLGVLVEELACIAKNTLDILAMKAEE